MEIEYEKEEKEEKEEELESSLLRYVQSDLYDLNLSRLILG